MNEVVLTESALATMTGCRITSKEAKDMAKVARWDANYHDLFREVWETYSEERKAEMDKSRLCQRPVREDFIQKTRDFAEWAEKSGGFTIH